MSGEIAIVVGAGPTVTGHLDWIQVMRRYCAARVFAVSAVARVLETAGMIPDVVCVLDTDRTGHAAAQLDGCASGGQLVYFEHVDPIIPQRWIGPRKAIVEPVPGDSVIHLATAEALETNPLVLHFVGVDFCNVDGWTHAEGVLGRQRAGERSTTDADFVKWRRQLEDLIQDRARVPMRVVQHDARGLRIAGAEYCDDAS